MIFLSGGSMSPKISFGAGILGAVCFSSLQTVARDHPLKCFAERPVAVRPGRLKSMTLKPLGFY